MEKFGNGNVRTKIPNGERGWIFGNFKENPLPFPWNYKDFEIKWADLKKGENSGGVKNDTIDTVTITVLVKGGPHKTTLYPGESNEVAYVLEKEGDFVFWGPGVPHSWEALEKNTTISFRYKVV